MRFVICYDITDDRRRARVSAALLDYGARLQESVFVATHTPSTAISSPCV
ncbi:MAG: CRISPR-associated endonuclease Cas2 [Bryobacteraceae bacterium]|nr:CRISPR-associated endonuclease Cas2 [Bryobacteraceae bacterium]